MSDQFEFPPQPPVPTISSRTSDQFTFPLMRSPFTLGCRVRMNDSAGFSTTTDISFPEDAPTGQELSVTVERLNAGHVYEMTISYITAVGESVLSLLPLKFNLPATSAPSALAISEASTTSLHLTWLPPAVTAPGVDISQIRYIITVEGLVKTLI